MPRQRKNSAGKAPAPWWGIGCRCGSWAAARALWRRSEPRTNCFARPSAANIDQLVIIASAAIPVTDPYLIDRIAAIAALKGCGVLVCLNKTDLDPADELFAIYSQSAIPALRVSAETGGGNGCAADADPRQAQNVHRKLRCGKSPVFSTACARDSPCRWGRSARPWAADEHHPPCRDVSGGGEHMGH